jgi:hypothetical protein
MIPPLQAHTAWHEGRDESDVVERDESRIIKYNPGFPWITLTP